QKQRIYSKSGAAPAPLGVDFGAYIGAATEATRRAAAGGGATPWNALDVQKEADRVGLAKFAPVGVVIDDNMTELQFRGQTGRYLEPAPGMASLDLLKMLREGLLSEVRAAIMKAKSENVTARKEGIPIREGIDIRLVNVEVMPIRVPPSGVRCYV